MSETKICNNCVMDTTDPKISFNISGVCSYCINFKNKILPSWDNSGKNYHILEKLADQIRKEGTNKEFDCIIGVSGGVDSSYLVYLAKKKLNLRPLIFHVDAGWNSKLAVENIEKIVDKLKLELHTEVVFWPEMKNLQLSFFKAQVPHIDTPQDHAFFASIYNYAYKHKIKYILNGGNFSTECIREPLEWHYHASDLYHVKKIHSQFGTLPLKKFPLAGIFKYKLYYRFLNGIRVIQPLNYIKYIKEKAVDELKQKFNWQSYSHKHYESRFTKFYEGYWLPKKFGYDKRKAHFSSLILTNQMKRYDALNKLKILPYDQASIQDDFKYIANKLGISTDDLQNIMNGKNRSFRDYSSHYHIINIFIKILNFFNVEKRIIR